MSTEKDLPHRIWSTVRDLWLDHVPPNLDPSDMDLLSRVSQEAGELVDKKEIPLVLGLREHVLIDALFLRSKSLYCIDCATSCNSQGFPTWSGAVMYDASFYAAKAFCYLMGIRDLSRDRNIYADIFLQKRTKKGKMLLDGHLMLVLKDRMTHEMLWKIFMRIIFTVTVDVAEFQTSILELRRFDMEQYSRERNRVLYKPFSWSREENLATSDIYSRTTYEKNGQFLIGDEDSAEYIAKYYFFAFAINNIVDVLLDDLGGYAPAVRAVLEARPGPRRLASLQFA